jgi:hypothetical protein
MQCIRANAHQQCRRAGTSRLQLLHACHTQPCHPPSLKRCAALSRYAWLANLAKSVAA